MYDHQFGISSIIQEGRINTGKSQARQTISQMIEKSIFPQTIKLLALEFVYYDDLSSL